MMMDLNKMIAALKTHPEYAKMGMIATHVGVVRGTSLDGREVTEMEVSFKKEAVSRILLETKEMPGIVEVVAETPGGRLKVGEEVMVVAVGGDTRDHVFPALIKAVDRIKSEATKKSEFFR
jgi:molybdopterin synthase catalytic subunit